MNETDHAIQLRIQNAETRYGSFASTHEALGVLLEEFNELQQAIHANNIDLVREEALDIAAVAIRLAEICDDPKFGLRSTK